MTGSSRLRREAIAREGKVRALAILEGLRRMGAARDWGDVSFMMEQGQHIDKMSSSAMKNGATTHLLLRPRDFAPRLSSSLQRQA
jgi:hypothetical protein